MIEFNGHLDLLLVFSVKLKIFDLKLHQFDLSVCSNYSNMCV